MIEEHEAEIRSVQAQAADSEEQRSQAVRHGLQARGHHGASGQMVAELEATVARMTAEAAEAAQRHQLALTALQLRAESAEAALEEERRERRLEDDERARGGDRGGS